MWKTYDYVIEELCEKPQPQITNTFIFICVITRIRHQLLKLSFGHLTRLQKLCVAHFLVSYFNHKTEVNNIETHLDYIEKPINSNYLPIDNLLLLDIHISQCLTFSTFGFQIIAKRRLLRVHTIESFGQFVQIVA